MNHLKLSFNLKKITIFIFLLFGGIVSAQTLPEPDPINSPPDIVQEHFQQKFPGVEVVWYRRYRGDYDTELRYQGKFLMNNKTVMAVYNQTGHLMAMVDEINPIDIPKKAGEYMKSHYPYDSIVQSAKITQVNKGVTYELGMYLDNSYVVIIFDENGKFIQLSKG